MKIAYNPLGSAAYIPAADNKDLIFDLVTRTIYVKGIPFDGTKYSTFKKHTSPDNTGGSEGLVPIPSYSALNNRLLREDGLWVLIAGVSAPDDALSLESTNSVENKVITKKFNEIIALLLLKAEHVYKNIVINGVLLLAQGANDTLTIIQGDGIALTPNSDNKSITISTKALGLLGISTSYIDGQLVVKVDDLYFNHWNEVFNWYQSVTEEDTDLYINKWLEIVDFLNNVQLGTNILDEFVTRKTDQTIIGTKTFSLQIISTVAEGTSPFIVDSSTRVLKLNADMVDDYHIRKWFNNASDIDNSSVLWQSNGTCSDIPSMSYSALINVIGDTGRRWQIWNSRNNHQLYWRPELPDMSGYAPEHILLDSLNYKGFIELMYWANVLVLSASDENTTPIFLNNTLSGKLIFRTAASTASISFLNGEYIDGYGNIYLGANSASWNVFDNSGTTLIKVLKNGNVGIGNNNPLKKLHVAGETFITGDTVIGDGSLDRTVSINSDTSSLRLFAWSNSTYIESGNETWDANVPLYLTGIKGNNGSDLNLMFNHIKANGILYVYSGSPGQFNDGIRLYGAAKNSTWSNILFGCDPSATSGTHANQWMIGRNTSNNFMIGAGSNYANTQFEIDTSGNVNIKGNTTLNGNLTLNAGDVDRYITFNYTGYTNSAYSWRIGYLGSGDGDANYLVLQSAKTDGSWTNALRLGLTTLNANFGGIVNAPAFTLNGASSAGTNYITGTAGRIFFGGNFHIDALGSNHLYLNHYTGYNVYMCSGSLQGSVGIRTSSPENALDVNGIQQIYQRGNDNTAFKNLLLLKQQNSAEDSNQSWTGSNPSFGIGFRRYWSSGSSPYGETTHAGIYATVSSAWKGGLVFRTKNNQTQGGTHDTTALRLRPDGHAIFGNSIETNGSVYINQPSSNRRAGIIGSYDPNRAAAIWSMGPSYQIASDGTTLGNLYGAAYVYYGSGYTFGAGKSNGHSFVWCQNGTPYVALGDSIWTRGDLIVESNQTLYGLTATCNKANDTNYMNSALQIREYNFGGAQADTWAIAPRLSWHWGGRVQTLIGLASNGDLYLSKNQFASAYRLVYESGTWGINISGNAASAGNADTVDGYHASGLVKFYLSPMTSNAPADSAKSWFTNTMPSASGAIVYNVPGSEKTIIAGKSSGTYGHMLQLNYDDTYLRILRYYNGSWKSTDWEKISAGHADSAGSSGYIWGNSISNLNSPTTWSSDGTRLVYDTYSGSASNKPVSVDNANGLVTFFKSRHGTSNQYVSQLAFPDHNRLYFRFAAAGSWGSWQTIAFTSDIPNPANYYWANIRVSASSSTGTLPTFNTCYTSNWFRSTGATGWYNESYTGGIYMEDTTWVRIYNGKKFYVSNGSNDAIHSAGGVYVAGCVHAYANYLKSTCNGHTVTIGSLNSSWCHIETSAPLFYINKSVLANGHFYEYSDIRKKNVIQKIEEFDLSKASIIQFKWKHDPTDIHIGVIALEIEEIVPEVVNTDPDGYKSVDYGVLGTVSGILAIKKISKLLEKIESLEKEIENLKNKN